MKTKLLNIIELIIGLLCVGYYVWCAQTVGTKISLLYGWMIIGMIIFVKGIVCMFKQTRENKVCSVIFGIYDVMFCAILISVIVFCIGIGLSYNDKGEKGADYLIILGAAVEYDHPSSVLQDRIDAAYNYLKENPDTRVIASGGIGSEDKISEAKCISNELIKKGIDKSRIQLEDESTTTVENVAWSVKLIPEKKEGITEDRSAVIVTTNFHLFRAKLVLESYTECKVSGIAADFSSILTPHYMLREYITFGVDMICGRL